ncbi:hypothetical protein GIW54_29615 [Pseudomonas proteolytica]|uniref:DUF2721 domain-containing protein n=1 Tax=Pseudomonas proteolytica TaxID=219574 RepID=A0AAW5AA27_9PSED|nr:hypothetical protein [Pseudomonas proteolytica]MCF5061194.1 hypothetical protein [Pseudomonas proteolytica]MCF5104868.1 hypothetical protein [Pseudomonas proteolytica]
MNKLCARDYAIIGLSLLATLFLHAVFVGWGKVFLCLEEASVKECVPLQDLNVLIKLYDDKLRSDFFSGFLAVGAFLLSLKTFIVMTMKTSVYDTDRYKEIWENNKRLDSNVGSRYEGLKELNNCMFSAIFFSLLAAVSQVTLGLVGGVVLVFISLWLCVASVSYLAYCLFLVKRNLDEIIGE